MSVIRQIAMERTRQLSKGYDAAHDDKHIFGEIAIAAASFAANEPKLYPWGRFPVHKRGRRERLIKAAALLVAEIERCDRSASTQSEAFSEAATFVKLGNIDDGRPACGQGDSYGRRPIDPDYGKSEPVKRSRVGPQIAAAVIASMLVVTAASLTWSYFTVGIVLGDHIYGGRTSALTGNHIRN